VDHAIVYRRENEFCSWPFTSGFWENAPGELIANFTARTVTYSSGDEINHDALERGGGGAPKMVTVRSRDRGKTWDGANPQIDMFASIGRDGGPLLERLPEAVDYRAPNVLVSNGSTGGFAQKTARGTVRVSKDGGATWGPTMVVPQEGLVSTTGVQSVLVRPDGRCLLFMFSVDQNNANRRPLVYGSTTDGTEFHFMSYIVPKVDVWGQTDGDYEGSIRFIGHRWFYPRGYMLASGRILCVTRCQRDPTGVMWSELFASDDGGATWEFLSRINDFGAPCSLVVMPDGRVVAVYGYRLMPSGIRAAVSEDGGKTWGPELIVRDDGGSWDLGYPNSWHAGDGQIGVLYYFNSKDDSWERRRQLRFAVVDVARQGFG
jgi:hypothetical protein